MTANKFRRNRELGLVTETLKKNALKEKAEEASKKNAIKVKKKKHSKRKRGSVKPVR